MRATLLVRILVTCAVATGLPSLEATHPKPLDTALGLVNLYFSAPLLSERLQASPSWQNQGGLTKDQSKKLAHEIWQRYREHQRAEPSSSRVQGRRVVLGDDRMVFSIRRPQTPANPGDLLPLTLSLHGGGAQTQAENDLQWKAQQERYEDAPGIYVCPRAPRDIWDQWHGARVGALIEALIQELLIHESVDPDRIYLMGYSAGGYGAFQLGGQMTDRFAAVAASAGAPTPGVSPVEHWQHLPLRFEIGEDDIAYGRVKLCRSYDNALRYLKGLSPTGYTFTYIEHEDRGHQIDDWRSTQWMAQHRRERRPKHLTWTPTSSQQTHYYWLSNATPTTGQRIEALIEENTIHLATSDVREITLRLDDALIDLDQAVTVYANGMKVFSGPVERQLATLVKTLEERGDPGLMYCSEIPLYIP